MEVSSFRRDEFIAKLGHEDLDNYTDEYVLNESSTSLIVAYCALFVIGVCCNAWVAFVIGRLLLDGVSNRRGSDARGSLVGLASSAVHGGAPRPIQIYILALCCCDLIVLGFLLLLILDLYYGRWIIPASTVLCQLYLCSESLNKFCGPFFLVALSGYCYVRVCRNDSCSAKTSVSQPLISVRPNGTKRLLSTTITISRTFLKTRFCIIILATCLCLVFVLITPVYMYGDVYYLMLHNASYYVYSITPKCAFQPPEDVMTVFTIYSFICGYLLPAGLFTFFYACIMKKAYFHAKLRLDQQRRSSSGITTGDAPAAVKTKRSPKTYLGRVVKTTLGLVLFYFVCWTPYWIMVLYQYTIPHDKQGEMSQPGVILSYFLHILPYVNCTGYPILYTVLNKSIKASYRQVKLKSDLKNSRLALIARQQSESKFMITTMNNLNGDAACKSRCNSFFFNVTPETSHPGSPRTKRRVLGSFLMSK